MDVDKFRNEVMGDLVAISGTDPLLGEWRHRAFVPAPLGEGMPSLAGATHLQIANARAALAALDSTANQLPNSTLFRTPTLLAEAQSTSALEGTYAPLAEVLIADEERPGSADLVEILNYVRMADNAYASVGEGRSLSTSLLCELNALLMRGAPLALESGQLRAQQVVVGRRTGDDSYRSAAEAARYVPPPPGDVLEAGVQHLTEWMSSDHRAQIDPVVSAAMGHYQFETLHPFRDGNGRLGRLLIVLQLQKSSVLTEPTLTVSPWFEARRGEYYDRLLAVSTDGDWDAYLNFFARGLEAAAQLTRRQMISLVRVQAELKEMIRTSTLRADSAHALVDLAVANPTFTVRQVEHDLEISNGRAHKVVGQLVELGILEVRNPDGYKRRYCAPRVLEVLTTR